MNVSVSSTNPSKQRLESIQNLLRTLIESRTRSHVPDNDLKLLLASVKEIRRQNNDHKLSDGFYESLENVLNDLRTITMDNNDAYLFLKPVSRTDYPDYHTIIGHPMDFQTMLKKVKQKQYKSKKEFKDDLDLMWSNCATYNADPTAAIRAQARRLQAKAEKLLMYVSDRKERTDPTLPPEFAGQVTTNGRLTIKINGHHRINGHSSSASPSPKQLSAPSFPPSKAGTPKLKFSRTGSEDRNKAFSFGETPALVRTPEGMAMFRELSLKMDDDFFASQASGSHSNPELTNALRDLIPESRERDLLENGEVDVKEEVDDSAVVPGSHKRKLNGFSETRARKRSKHNPQLTVPVPLESDPMSQLWWEAVQSPHLFANALPPIPFPSSSSSGDRKPDLKRKRRRKTMEVDEPEEALNTKSMLYMMNNNIKAMKRVRHTHAKFVALGFGGEEANEGTAEGTSGPAPGIGPVSMPVSMDGIEEEVVGIDEGVVDDRPWGAELFRKRKGKGKGKALLEGVDIGERLASDCLDWTSKKILEHAGFQGAAKSALDMFSDVLGNYLMNVGRTIKYLCDKHGRTMTPEEIILHTLFESGVSQIQDLDRFIHDDVERYGNRLGELEKKIVGAYNDTVGKMIDPSQGGIEDEEEGLFEEEDEEDASALARGEFADTLNVDFFGFKEMGLDVEFGLSSLSIPRTLLKVKKRRMRPSAILKPKEPPPPFPPPPPFIPLSSSMVNDQIGLLKPFYLNKLATISASQPPPPSVLGPPVIPPLSKPSYPAAPSGSVEAAAGPSAPQYSQPPAAVPSVPRPEIIIPDDLPNPAQMKMGPIGQILTKTTTAAASQKKKPKAPPEGSSVIKFDGVPSAAPGNTDPAAKKKGPAGGATVNGKKKKSLDTAQGGQILSPTIAQIQSPSQSQAPKPQPPPHLPPVVAASA